MGGGAHWVVGFPPPFLYVAGNGIVGPRPAFSYFSNPQRSQPAVAVEKILWPCLSKKV